MRYVLLVVALASCTYSAAKIGLGVSGAMMLTGTVIGETADDHGFVVTQSELGWTLAVAGLIAAIPCLAVLSNPPRDGGPPVDSAETRRREIRDRREQAWRLTQDAAAAATNGHCDVALELGEQIAAIDADFHDSVYVHNAAIARCTAH